MLALLPTDGRDPLVQLDAAPEPAPRPDEALVAVEAFSINRGETFLLEHPRPGLRPGKDVAGRVARAAADGSGPRTGERVVGHPPLGGWAQLAAVPTAALAVLPAGVDAVTAAALPLAGLTALRLLRAAGSVSGRRVLLTGASGGVGHYVTELAAAAGAEVTAVTASPERGERLLALGAVDVVSTLGAARGPFDVALESVGGESLPHALGLLGAAGGCSGTARRAGRRSRSTSSRSSPRPGRRSVTSATRTPPSRRGRTSPPSCGWWQAAGCTRSSGASPTGARRPPRSPTCASAGSEATRCCASRDEPQGPGRGRDRRHSPVCRCLR